MQENFKHISRSQDKTFTTLKGRCNLAPQKMSFPTPPSQYRSFKINGVDYLQDHLMLIDDKSHQLTDQQKKGPTNQHPVANYEGVKLKSKVTANFNQFKKKDIQESNLAAEMDQNSHGTHECEPYTPLYPLHCLKGSYFYIQPGTPVSIVATKGPFAQVCTQGKLVGYVLAEGLKKM